MVDAAVQQTGAILTPIYPTIAVNELEFILNDAQVKIIFVNDEDLFHKVLSIKAQVPSLREIYTFEHVAGARHWKELLATPTPEEEQRLTGLRTTIKETDLATIIYTSGTTGVPKGVMLSHYNILSNVKSCIPCLPQGVSRVLSFLPLNHIYERMLTLCLSVQQQSDLLCGEHGYDRGEPEGGEAADVRDGAAAAGEGI